MAADVSKVPKKFLSGYIPYIIGGVLIIAALIPSVYFYTQYQQAQHRLANPTAFAEEEVKRLVGEVGTLMILPSDETPTVATITDTEKLKNQPFFARSANGDKVLIYTQAKKAILYRSSIHKIIDVAPINIGPAASVVPQPTGITPTPATVKFVLLNGTSVVGLTKKYATELKGIVKNAEVVDTNNAVIKTYAKTILVDVKGDKSVQAQQFAKSLDITVMPLPAGEATPSSDFLIILGADKK